MSAAAWRTYCCLAQPNPLADDWNETGRDEVIMAYAENVDPALDRSTALPLELLRCPVSGAPLSWRDGALVSRNSGGPEYRLSDRGIPLFAEQFCSPDARVQQAHYEKVAAAYVQNLHYPHTAEYMLSLDNALLSVIDPNSLGTVAELCCGRGEAFQLIGNRVGRGIGVDISLSMLEAALTESPGAQLTFVQGDATMLPLADAAFDSVFMLGGVHHVTDRTRLFTEIARILKPGGAFYFREPVSDLALWRLLRAVVYRLSPALDAETERPLQYISTIHDLQTASLECTHWSTHGFIGFCLFMNSDVCFLIACFVSFLEFVPLPARRPGSTPWP